VPVAEREGETMGATEVEAEGKYGGITEVLETGSSWGITVRLAAGKIGAERWGFTKVFAAKR